MWNAALSLLLSYTGIGISDENRRDEVGGAVRARTCFGCFRSAQPAIIPTTTTIDSLAIRYASSRDAQKEACVVRVRVSWNDESRMSCQGRALSVDVALFLLTGQGLSQLASTYSPSVPTEQVKH